MTAKRYLARDMGSALKKVREELGPDAIILSSKRADKGVEIIATLDDVAPSPEKHAKKRFVEAFDDEFDQPLASDPEWSEHHKASRIAANTQVSAVRKSAPSTPSSLDPTATSNTARTNNAKTMGNTRSIGNNQSRAGKKTIDESVRMSESTAQSAARLAKEVQDAHNRMLAAQAQSYEGEQTAPVNSPVDSNSKGYSSAHGQIDTHGQIGVPGQIEVRGQNRQLAGFAEQAKARGIDDTSAEDQTKLHSLYDEIAEMRMLLEEQLWQQPQSASRPIAAQLSGRAKQLAGQLAQLGLSDDVIQELLICANDNERLPNCWRKALALLVRRLPTDNSDAIEQGGTFAFVGPTGVGKTTTIAKLAARYVLNHGRGKVAIVTTDTYRVGAHDQLKALGRILQVPVRSIEGEHQLDAVLSSLKKYELVLIDTAGFRQGDPKLIQQESLISACEDVQRVLVLAANSQQQILKASIHAYSRLSPVAGCIFTKLDECANLGEAFSALCFADIPLVYTSAGQEIPDDIHVASGSDLVAQAVKLARQYQGTASLLREA